MAKNSEQQFSALLGKALKAKFEPSYAISEKKALLYKLHLDPNLHIQPSPTSEATIEPKRGVYAFETDLLIEDSHRPLVVCELKLGITSHDVITYSAKAAKHKEIYPFLRYGLLIGGQSTVDARFFTHNSDLDFVLALSLDQPALGQQFTVLYDLVENQIKSAERLVRVFQRSRVSRYESRIEIEAGEEPSRT